LFYLLASVRMPQQKNFSHFAQLLFASYGFVRT